MKTPSQLKGADDCLVDISVIPNHQGLDMLDTRQHAQHTEHRSSHTSTRECHRKGVNGRENMPATPSKSDHSEHLSRLRLNPLISTAPLNAMQCKVTFDLHLDKDSCIRHTFSTLHPWLGLPHPTKVHGYTRFLGITSPV